MDIRKILVYVVTGCLLVLDPGSAYINQTYGDIAFILSNVSTDYMQGQTSLAKAQNWCQSKGYTLAKIPDEGVQNNMQQFISSAISRGLMYGNDLIILNGKLIRSLTGTWMWVNGQQINGVDIKDQLELSQRYFYGYLRTSDFKIHASTHNGGRPYICENPGNANDCVGGLPLKGRCYQRKTNSLTWYSARNDCVEGGGDLASFETLNDTTFNSTLGSTLLANAPSTEYWVGMQSVEWRWEDTGLPIQYTNWETSAPSNTDDCLSLRLTSTPEWLWYGYGCSQTYRFICMATNLTTPVPTTSTSSTVTMDASSTKSTSGSVTTPTSPSFSVQPTSNSSASYAKTTKDSGLALGLGLGLGLGVGALLVVAIVLAVIFIRRRQKNKSNPKSELASSGDTTAASNGLKESDIDAENIENNGSNKYDASTGSSNPGAIYATVQSSGTLLPPTNHAKTYGAQTVYADFDLVQKP